MRRALVVNALVACIGVPVAAGVRPAPPQLTVKAVLENTRVHLHGTAPSGTRVRWIVQPQFEATDPQFSAGANWSKPKVGVIRAKHGRYSAVVEVPWSGPASVRQPRLQVLVGSLKPGVLSASTDVAPSPS